MSSACSSTSETQLIIRRGATICQWQEVAFTRLTLPTRREKTKWWRKQRSRKEEKRSSTLPHRLLLETVPFVKMISIHGNRRRVAKFYTDIQMSVSSENCLRGQTAMRNLLFTCYIHNDLFNHFTLCVCGGECKLRVGGDGAAVGLCALTSEGAGICRLLDRGERCRSVTPANLG